MPHGYPDWGRDTAQDQLYGLPDMAELAARLWSPDTFNRHGHVIFMDGFEAGLNKWLRPIDGADAAVGITRDEARNGLCSCKLTAGSTLLHSAGIEHQQPLEVLSRFGFEISWCTTHTIEEFIIEIYLEDGVNALGYRVRWDVATQQLEYWTFIPPGPAAWALLAAGVNFVLATSLFHTWKLIVDARTQQYVAFVSDNITYPMAGLVPTIAGPFLGPVIIVTAENVGVLGHNRIVYVDDAILTQHEP